LFFFSSFPYCTGKHLFDEKRRRRRRRKRRIINDMDMGIVFVVVVVDLRWW
jgi:hypothetical protein